MTAETSPPDAPAPRVHRPIRSFVLRRGHLSDAQRDAHARLLPHYGVPDEPRLVDPLAVFGRRAPLVLEIGFGVGQATAEFAAGRPDLDVLGIEVYTPGVGSLLRQLEARGLSNVRVIQHDAVAVVRERIAADSLAAIHVWFPDPWPKKRHHERLLIQPAFVAELATRLQPGGYLHCATDWADYAEQMRVVLGGEPLLHDATTDWTRRPAWRAATRFEARGLRLGHDVRDLVFVRRAAAPAP